MSSLSHDGAQNANLVARARSLRLQCGEVLQRAGLLHHRAADLLAVSGDLRVRVEAQRTAARAVPVPVPVNVALPDAAASEELAWYRAQVREMLNAGWTRGELEDVGVTDELLADLGLQRPA